MPCSRPANLDSEVRESSVLKIPAAFSMALYPPPENASAVVVFVTYDSSFSRGMPRREESMNFSRDPDRREVVLDRRKEM